MTDIIVTSNPHPDPDKPYPPEIVAAFEGLRLPVNHSTEPGEEGPYPQGAHLVRMVDVLHAIQQRDARAYELLIKLWGPIAAQAGPNTFRVCIPFPFDCCKAIN